MDELPNLRKREWDALGGLLLPPSMGGKISLGPKTGPKLKALGLVEEFDLTIPAKSGQPAWMAIKIRAWQMTALGYRVYCEWSSRQKIDDEWDDHS